MRDFKRRSSDRGRRDNESREMHEATCSKCGSSCQVPFNPRGDRPIFCSDCFRTVGPRNPDNRSAMPDRKREMFSAICAECGKECSIPFKPRTDKPVYCSDCFEKTEKGSRESSNSNIQEQLDAINIKLGKILQMLSSKASTPTPPEESKESEKE